MSHEKETPIIMIRALPTGSSPLFKCYQHNGAVERAGVGQSIGGQSQKALPYLHQAAGEGRKEVAQQESCSGRKRFDLSEEMKHRACLFRKLRQAQKQSSTDW